MPSLESFGSTGFEMDEELDNTLDQACEAMKIPVKDTGADPENFKDLPLEEIEALVEAGSEDEDEDDDLDQESVENLLSDLPNAMYGVVDATDELDSEDEADIADDFDDDDF